MPRKGQTLLTKELIEDVKKYVPACLFGDTIAAYLGIGRRTWYDWLHRGKREERRLGNPKAKPKQEEALFVELSRAVRKGLAEGEMRAIAGITAAGAGGTWTAFAWILERRFPERWGKDSDETKECLRMLREIEERHKGAAPPQNQEKNPKS